MYFAKDYRDWARTALGIKWTGNRWGTFVVIVLIYSLITGAVAAFGAYPFFAAIAGIGSLLIAGPFTLGLTSVSLNTVRGDQIKIEMLFGGFKDFTRAFVLMLLNSIFIFLWALLFIIPGIIKTYAYSMSFYILRDNPTMSANDARKLSMQMMHGNKWRLFCLQFSFIGWFLLGVLTLGILLLWVIPYYKTAEACFYTSLIQPPKPVEKPAEELIEKPAEEQVEEPASDM